MSQCVMDALIRQPEFPGSICPFLVDEGAGAEPRDRPTMVFPRQKSFAEKRCPCRLATACEGRRVAKRRIPSPHFMRILCGACPGHCYRSWAGSDRMGWASSLHRHCMEPCRGPDPSAERLVDIRVASPCPQ